MPPKGMNPAQQADAEVLRIRSRKELIFRLFVLICALVCLLLLLVLGTHLLRLEFRGASLDAVLDYLSASTGFDQAGRWRSCYLEKLHCG